MLPEIRDHAEWLVRILGSSCCEYLFTSCYEFDGSLAVREVEELGWVELNRQVFARIVPKNQRVRDGSRNDENKDSDEWRGSSSLDKRQDGLQDGRLSHDNRRPWVPRLPT